MAQSYGGMNQRNLLHKKITATKMSMLSGMQTRYLPELTADELQLWHIDQRINDRGIPHDMVFVESAIKLVDYAKIRANEEISQSH